MLVRKKFTLKQETKKPKFYGRAVEIKAMREEGMSQEEIADALGVCRRTVTKCMNKFYIQ